MIVVLFHTVMNPEAVGPEYSATSARVHELVAQIPGRISMESYESSEGKEISIVKFESEEALKQ